MSSAPISEASQEVVTGVGNCISVFFDRSKVGRRPAAEIFFTPFFEWKTRVSFYVMIVFCIQALVKQRKLVHAETLAASVFAAMMFF